MAALQSVAAYIRDRIRGFRVDSDGWKIAKQTEAATVYWKPSTDWNGSIYKTEGILESGPETVFHFINPTSTDSPRNDWDKSIKHRAILQQQQTDVYVIRTVTHSALAGLISSRLFIDVVVIERNEQFLATAAKSVDYDCESSADGADSVRGTNYPSAIICNRIPGSPEKTHLTTYIQSDIGGLVPKSLIEQALPSSQLSFFAALTQALKDAGHWNQPTQLDS